MPDIDTRLDVGDSEEVLGFKKLVAFMLRYYNDLPPSLIKAICAVFNQDASLAGHVGRFLKEYPENQEDYREATAGSKKEIWRLAEYLHGSITIFWWKPIFPTLFLWVSWCENLMDGHKTDPLHLVYLIIRAPSGYRVTRIP